MRKGNSKTLRFIFLFLILPFAVGVAFAQEPEFRTSVSASKIAQHSVFQVQFELLNANGLDFRPPSFESFKVVGGPSIGSSTMVINGAVSRSQSWSYSLLATTQGKWTIGSATVVAGSKKFITRPVSIEVIAPKDIAKQGATSSSREPVLLRAETDRKSYYPGQQIILTYRLLFRENVQTVSTISEDDYADFFIQHFSDFSREATYETINGLQFTSRIIKSIALYAHQSGTYTIDPMVMSAGINAPFPGNQGFFTMRRIQDVQVASEPLTITILPLPANAPASYSGAVGAYQMTLTPGKTEITTDEAFTFQAEITGNGDSRRWDVPVAVVNGDFETYEPRILEDNVFDAGNEVSHIRKVAYQMIPAKPGDYSVVVPFTYFDPTQKQYVTITSDTIQLHVTQGTGVPLDTSSLNKIASGPPELMKIHPVLLKDKFWVSIPHLLLFAMVLSGSGLSLFYAARRKRENQMPEAQRIRNAAAVNAIHQYNHLEANIHAMPGNTFFEKATEAYYKFLIDRFMIPSSELDEANLKKYMTRADVSESLTDRAVVFFNQCLTVRYGGIPGGYSREEMLRECRALTQLLA
ncbi:MAG TPA: BatD family protein [Saprospiraceae bacterium]|nr:BatD family protein [Saprospiraceae bacterium]